MPFQCPLCDAGSPDEAAYVGHLADAHGLVDDEGATTPQPAPVEPPAASPPLEPAMAPPGFAPLEPPVYGAPPPPPSGWIPPAHPPQLPPPPVAWIPPMHPPPLPPPPSAAGPEVAKSTIALIVASILVVAVAAMYVVGGSSSPTASRTVIAPTTVTLGEAPASSDSSSGSSASSPTGAATAVIASSTSPTDSVDPNEAKTVATKLWAGMTAALRVFEDGPLLESDIGSLCQVGCPPPGFSAMQSLTVNVPHQTAWPAVFFATVTYASGCNSVSSPCVNEFVAVQAEQGQPWKATLLISYGGETLSSVPQFLPDGFAVAPAEASAVVPVLLADFADYDNALKATGQKPSSTRLEDGPFTSDNAARLFDPPEDQRLRGVSDPTIYSVDPADPIYTFSTGSGTTTGCGTIRYTASMTSADGSALPASASIDEWSMLLPDGSYRSMTMLGLHMVCFSSRANEPTAIVVASWGGSASVTGERA